MKKTGDQKNEVSSEEISIMVKSAANGMAAYLKNIYKNEINNLHNNKINEKDVNKNDDTPVI